MIAFLGDPRNEIRIHSLPGYPSEAAWWVSANPPWEALIRRGDPTGQQWKTPLFRSKEGGKTGVNHLQNTWLNIHFPELCWIEDISRYIRLYSFSVADDFLDFDTLQKVISKKKIDW